MRRALEAGLGVGNGVAVPVGLGEADAQVLDRLGPQVGADLLAGRLALVGVDHQVVELAHRLREAVVAVVRPGELVERAVVVRRVLELQHALERRDRQAQLVGAVEVELADAGPGLGDELRLLDRLAVEVRIVVRLVGLGQVRRIHRLELVGADQRQHRLARLRLLPHFTQAEAEQVVGGVEQAVVRELGQQALVERDRRRVVHARRRRRRRVRRIDRLLVRLVGVEELLGRLLVVELGEAEHRVRRPALVVRVLVQEVLEHRDRVHATFLGLLVVERDLRVVLGADLLRLVRVGALDDHARRRAVVLHDLGEVLDVAGHLVESARVDRPRRQRRRHRLPRADVGREQARRERERADGQRVSPHLSSSITFLKSSSRARSSRFLRLVSLVTAWVF